MFLIQVLFVTSYRLVLTFELKLKNLPVDFSPNQDEQSVSKRPIQSFVTQSMLLLDQQDFH